MGSSERTALCGINLSFLALVHNFLFCLFCILVKADMMLGLEGWGGGPGPLGVGAGFEVCCPATPGRTPLASVNGPQTPVQRRCFHL